MTTEERPAAGPLRGLALYPLASAGGVGFLAIGTTLIALTHSLGPVRRRDPRVYLLALLALLIASYLYRVLEETVTGSDRPPNLKPDDWEDAWHDLLHYLGGILVAFLPVVCLLVYALMEQRGHLSKSRYQFAVVTFLVLGTLYFPMALLLNGFAQRFATAFNFNVGFRSIRAMAAGYAVCCLYFFAAHGAWILMEIFWVAPTARGWNTPRLTAAAGTGFIGLYLSVLQMRVLGLLYRKHHDRLGWSLGSDA